jgi:hypothetical protein
VLYVGFGLITVEVVRKPSVISAAAKVFYLHLCVPASENAAYSFLYATNAPNAPVVCASRPGHVAICKVHVFCCPRCDRQFCNLGACSYIDGRSKCKSPTLCYDCVEEASESVTEKTYGNLIAACRRCTTKLCEHCVKVDSITCVSCEEIMCPACHPSEALDL